MSPRVVEYRVLHLSDTHLTLPVSRIRSVSGRMVSIHPFNRRPFEALSWWIKINQNLFDFTIITGDIVNQATADNLNLAQLILANNNLSYLTPHLDPRCRNAKLSTLNCTQKPFFIMPGNHDRLETLFPTPVVNFNRFNSAFSQDWPNPKENVDVKYYPSKSSPDLALICADFSLRDPNDSTCYLGAWGQGRVYEDTLAQLLKRTEEVLSRGIAALWVVHFPPDHEQEESVSLIDHELLLKEGSNIGVNTLFSGHTHQKKIMKSRFDDLMTLYCTGTCTCERNGWDTSFAIRKIKLEEGKIISISTVTYNYNNKYRAFV